ncbi:demethylmenaquinone methyltransferase [Alicyclobacillus mengziensis]|uniref:Demethylmenaquinone methyltransferase n=1 Tax=Alicyclobacillus mengziensis TaxID=2931921 RepID=A0A9X7VWD0_9BACL|nr:demethylmenaquinone methyltransferase [Alicyclobacillus mengziensis]QSO45732.1 demethylmenaquinone methyltransferase [Alicyclobacillus mengziensis]
MDRETKSAHVKAVFSDIADHYDLMNSVLSFWQHKIWRRFAMKQVNVGKGGQALDVACGTGDWTLSLAKAVGDKGKVVGIDFTREMLNVAKEKLSKRGFLNRTVELVEGDAMDLPFAENSFDVATIGFALRNVPDILTVLTEMTRVVKPGGRVVSLELSKPETPIFRSLYYLYFNHVLPHIGSLAAGSKKSYAWLPESLVDFPDRRNLEKLFRQAGLSDVRSYPLTGGIAALHVGRKA